MFREFLRREPDNPDAAMEQAMAFAASLPRVERAERAGWEILVYYETGVLAGRMQLVGAHFDPGPGPNNVETRLLRERREERIVDRFHEILKALDAGATLAVGMEKGYQLEDY